jgi:valyl-tRNA synthetase
MPFLTEEMYAHVYQNKVGIDSLHRTKFAEAQTEYVFEDSAQIMQQIMHVIATVRKLKTEKQLSLKTPLKNLTIYADDSVIDSIKKQEQLIRGITQAEIISYISGHLDKDLIEEKDGLWHIILSLPHIVSV